MNHKYASDIQLKLDQLAEQTTIDGGIWRAAYTNEDKIAKNLVKRYMKEAGLEVREDQAGNLFGRLPGADPRVILTGSHLDTVKSGGKYDGALGVITAIQVLGQLASQGVKPAKTIEVVAFAEEEGSRFDQAYVGSRAITGKVTEADLLEQDLNGISLADALAAAGLDPAVIKQARRDDIDLFIELHIEQGPVLEQRNKQIGIVQSIVGLRVYRIKLIGEQNHAGTTPMKLRKDPLRAAASLLSELYPIAEAHAGTATLTFGKIEVFPGMSNVVPERVELLMDLRDGDDDSLDQLEYLLTERIRVLEQSGFQVTIHRTSCEPAAILSLAGIELIRKAVTELGLTSMDLNSGAGHDAQILADQVPACMIFIPSKKGISHNPLEFSTLADLEAGAITLERVLRLAAW